MADNATNGRETVAAERTLSDYAVIDPNACATSITTPAVTAQNFEIKPAYINLVQQSQFSGAPSEDPREHIANFLSILDFFKIQGASDEAIRLRMFPLSLRDRAKSWLTSFPHGTFTTWEVLARKFIDKYFPPSRQARLRQELIAFTQQEGESLHEAWERYNQMLKKCPNHGLPDWMQVRSFYDGLRQSIKGMVDAAAGGSLDMKTIPEARELIERMAHNSSHTSERGVLRKADVALAQMQTLFTQNKEMQQQIASLTKQLSQVQLAASIFNPSSSPTPPSAALKCDFCGGGHQNGNCGVDPSAPGNEQVHFVGGGQRNVSNTFNQGYRNHPNFSWHSPALQPPQDKQPAAWESAIEKLANYTSSFVEETRQNFKNQGASLRNLEVQVGQLTKQLAERPQRHFPSDTVAIPNEQCSIITLRNGKTLEEPRK